MAGRKNVSRSGGSGRTTTGTTRGTTIGSATTNRSTNNGTVINDGGTSIIFGSDGTVSISTRSTTTRGAGSRFKKPTKRRRDEILTGLEVVRDHAQTSTGAASSMFERSDNWLSAFSGRQVAGSTSAVSTINPPAGVSKASWKAARRNKLSAQYEDVIPRPQPAQEPTQTQQPTQPQQSPPQSSAAQAGQPDKLTRLPTHRHLADIDEFFDQPPIFPSVVAYVNGSTYPAMPDYQLRQMLASHGARLSLDLSRRDVTHVIITPEAVDFHIRKYGVNSVLLSRSGGELVGSKIGQRSDEQQEPRVYYVAPSWVTDSVAAGNQLPEDDYTGMIEYAEARANAALPVE